MGTPKRSEIRVEHNGESRTRVVSRNFTIATFGLGLVSLYTGFIWAWEFPEDIEMQAPMGHRLTGDPWLMPLSSSRDTKKAEQLNAAEQADQEGTDSREDSAPKDPWLSPM